MKPLTPDMLIALKTLAYRRDHVLLCHASVRAGLIKRGLITMYSLHRWQLTDAGRRVLAEHTTTGDE